LTRIHPWAAPAAETMECVYRQDNQAFWNVKNQIFANQKSISEETAQDTIIEWSSEQGVSKKAVRNCLENDNPQEEVKQDQQEGTSFDVEVNGNSFVSGTPGTVIYAEGDQKGTPVVGAQPYSVFENIIESKLN